MRNLHLVLNKLIYRQLGTPAFSTSMIECNLQVTRSTFIHERDYVPPVPGSRTFTLEVAYPGLMAGNSMPRGVGRVAMNAGVQAGVRQQRQARDFNGGIAVDYTTGQPYIPASTVKGMLRSYFKRYPLAIAEIVGCPPEEVPALEQELFEEKDVYFDAVVFDSDHRTRLLAREAIAKHESSSSRVRLLTFIKLRPGVRLQFRFMPTDGRLSADRKLELFRRLLLIGGIGARRRTGYGVLLETDELPRPKEASVKHDVNRRQCPHCLSMIYRLDVNGRPHTRCYRCKLPLEEETDHATV